MRHFRSYLFHSHISLALAPLCCSGPWVHLSRYGLPQRTCAQRPTEHLSATFSFSAQSPEVIRALSQCLTCAHFRCHSPALFFIAWSPRTSFLVIPAHAHSPAHSTSPHQNMPKSYLTQDQRLRAQHVCSTHKHLKELSLATKEALKYQDKYLSAMERVMNCLSNSSDVMEDARKKFDEEAAVNIQPTSSTTSRLVTAYRTWHMSAEQKMMRTELEYLKEACITGREAVKKTKKTVHVLENVAKKCAHVNSPSFNAKMSRKSGTALEKVLQEQRETNTEMTNIENASKTDMMSLVQSWSAQLATRSDALYTAFGGLGCRTVACFPAPDPALPLGLPPPADADVLPASCSASNSESCGVGTAIVDDTPPAYPAPETTESSAVPLESAS
ncbi:hypothetical protein, unknown function [Leishmania tarentolae]|uniref:Uncharacterized protein n=1 Tax=Leishmania tarentolae TaxID=5689 RepID=A0A640KNL0_LEITA|nr:hypothetical protein, unknown function [Leishmania tarentolae]